MNMDQNKEILNRAVMPVPRGEIDFNLPLISKFTMDNGMRVIFVKKNKLPIVQMTLVTEAGSKFDPEKKKGLTQLLAAVMDEGAGQYDSLRLSEELEFLGSSLSVSSDADCMFLSLMTLKENLEKSFSIMASVIKEPHLKDEDFQREKNKLLTRIIQLKDDPSYTATIAFNRIVYGEHNPYSLPDTGTAETVAAIGIEDLRLYYASQFSPLNSTMVVVGDTDEGELHDLFGKYLQGWHQGKPLEIVIEERVPAERRIYIINKDDAVQSELRIGHPSSGRHAADYFPRMAMNMILGGQFSSRINLNLRENKGFTYGAHSAYYYDKQGAYFCVSAAVKSENSGDSVTEILKELDAIRDNIFEKELRFAKSSLIRKFPAQFETYGQIAGNLAALVIHDMDESYFNGYVSNVKKITMEATLEAARRNILPDRLVMLIVGDMKVLLPQMEALQITGITELDNEGNVLRTVG